MVVSTPTIPDIGDLHRLEVRRSRRSQRLVTGSKIQPESHLKAVMKACRQLRGKRDDCFDPEKNPRCVAEIKLAGGALSPTP